MRTNTKKVILLLALFSIIFILHSSEVISAACGLPYISGTVKSRATGYGIYDANFKFCSTESVGCYSGHGMAVCINIRGGYACQSGGYISCRDGHICYNIPTASGGTFWLYQGGLWKCNSAPTFTVSKTNYDTLTWSEANNAFSSSRNFDVYLDVSRPPTSNLTVCVSDCTTGDALPPTTIKDMTTGEEFLINQSNLVDEIRPRIDAGVPVELNQGVRIIARGVTITPDFSGCGTKSITDGSYSLGAYFLGYENYAEADLTLNQDTTKNICMNPLYFDCGLRINDGAEDVTFACKSKDGAQFRMFNGTDTYGIVLVDPIDPMASKVMISTAAGTKAIRKLQ